MKENSIKNERSSIEEDMKILEEFKTHGYAMLLIKYEDRNKTNLKIEQVIEHILSDYKRVLQENEYMHNELDKQQTKINKYAKENEELKKFLRMGSEVAENSILIPKIKCKIEELDIAISECEYSDDDDERYKKAVEKDKICLLNQKRVLKQLLESEK